MHFSAFTISIDNIPGPNWVDFLPTKVITAIRKQFARALQKEIGGLEAKANA